MPSILASARVRHWIDTRLSRWLLAGNELFGVITSIGCGVCLFFRWHLAILAVILCVRSLILFTSRAGYLRWIKLITAEPPLQSSRLKLFFFTFFLSTATAGFLVAMLLSKPSISLVVIIDVITYLVACGVATSLRPLQLVGTNATPMHKIDRSPLSTMREIRNNIGLYHSFVAVVLSQSLFQGAYSHLITYLPITELSLASPALALSNSQHP